MTVTRTQVSRDLSIAYVHVSLMGATKEQRQMAFARLRQRVPQVRGALGRRIRHQMRAVPEVRFFLDESLDYASRMDSLIAAIRAERAQREA